MLTFSFSLSQIFNIMVSDSDSERSLFGTEIKPEKSKKKEKTIKASKPQAKSKVSKKPREKKPKVEKKPPKWHCPEGEERIRFLNHLKGWF